MSARFLMVLTGSVCLLLATAPSVQSGYDIVRLTDNPHDDGGHQLNDAGWVTWHGSDGEDYEIYLFDGDETLQITDNTYDDKDPQISAAGDVVWSGDPGTSEEIFLFDGETIHQITDNDFRDRYPQLNAAGQITWEGMNGGDHEVFLYDGVTVHQLTDNAFGDRLPRINEAGQVAWYGSDGRDYEIFLYDGAQTVQLTDNDHDDKLPDVNDAGFVAWHGGAGSNAAFEVYLYNGLFVSQLTSNDDYDRAPVIDAGGRLAWAGRAPGGPPVNTDIHLYDGYFLKDISGDPDHMDRKPDLSGAGHVAWQKHDGNDWEIFVHDGERVSRLTDDLQDDELPRINRRGDVVWMHAEGTDHEIYLALKQPDCVDMDGDGYGNPPGSACAYPEGDCDDSNAEVNPGMEEIPGNGIDDDCNPWTPALWQPPPADASTLGEGSVRGTRTANRLLPFLIPSAGVLLWRGARRRRGGKGQARR